MVPGDEFTHDGWRYAPRPAPFDWQQIPEIHQQRRPTAAGLFGLFVIVCALTMVLLLIAGTRT